MPRIMPRARAWTLAEDRELISFRRRGISFSLIADHMKIPAVQLKMRAATLRDEGVRLTSCGRQPGQARAARNAIPITSEDRRVRSAAADGSAALLHAIRRAHPERCNHA